MGFRFSDEPRRASSIPPEAIVNALFDAKAHVSTHWLTAERTNEFMRDQDSDKWWPAYVLQVAGCGHLIMHSFIQQLLDTVQ
jgi:hypothetical protein